MPSCYRNTNSIEFYHFVYTTYEKAVIQFNFISQNQLLFLFEYKY